MAKKAAKKKATKAAPRSRKKATTRKGTRKAGSSEPAELDVEKANARRSPSKQLKSNPKTGQRGRPKGQRGVTDWVRLKLRYVTEFNKPLSQICDEEGAHQSIAYRKCRNEKWQEERERERVRFEQDWLRESREKLLKETRETIRERIKQSAAVRKLVLGTFARSINKDEPLAHTTETVEKDTKTGKRIKVRTVNNAQLIATVLREETKILQLVTGRGDDDDSEAAEMSAEDHAARIRSAGQDMARSVTG